MSVSINMHIEVKKDGKWMHYSAPSILKDRMFFDLLSGIYGVFPPVASHKGLPEDMSEMTKYCYQMSEEDNLSVHYQGWLSSDEIAALQRRLNDQVPADQAWTVDLEEAYFHCYIRGNAVSSHHGFEDSRLIFWFC